MHGSNIPTGFTDCTHDASLQGYHKLYDCMHDAGVQLSVRAQIDFSGFWADGVVSAYRCISPL